MRVTVVGSGAWGSTVAAMAAMEHPVRLWCRRAELADTINRTGENPDHLPGHRLGGAITATASVGEALADTRLVVMAVPSHGFRTVMESVAPHLGDDIPLLSLTKGIEQGTTMRMTEIVAAVAPSHDRSRTGVLTGPNLAGEMVSGAPAAAVIGMEDQEVASHLQTVFMHPGFRVYRNPDVIGCEIAGAVKNVMAIAAGMAKGLGFGHNTLAALITRALAELTRLGVAMGGRPETFAGLAGMGDLIATCQSDDSRNNRVGMALAQGRSLPEILSGMSSVAEGVKTAGPVVDMAHRLGIDMPIAAHVVEVLEGRTSPRDAVLSLMTREARSEA